MGGGLGVCDSGGGVSWAVRRGSCVVDGVVERREACECVVNDVSLQVEE